MSQFITVIDTNHKVHVINVDQIKNVHYIMSGESPFLVEVGLDAPIAVPRHQLFLFLQDLGLKQDKLERS